MDACGCLGDFKRSESERHSGRAVGDSHTPQSAAGHLTVVRHLPDDPGSSSFSRKNIQLSQLPKVSALRDNEGGSELQIRNR